MESIFGIPFNETLNELPAFGEGFSSMFGAVGDVFASLGKDGPPSAFDSPKSAHNYLVNKRDMKIKSAQQKPMVRLADKNMDIIGEIVNEVSGEEEEIAHDSGTARIVVTQQNAMADWMVNRTRIDEDLHLIIDPIPTRRNWRTRWGGKVSQINVKKNEDGTSTVELLALSHREHSKYLLFGANPVFPPEVQLPKMWVLPGPVRTIMFASMFVNLARLFVPGLSTVTNAFNPLSWLDPLNPTALTQFDPLSWPIQVAFVNPLLDQSRVTALGATWADWHSTTLDMLKDTGVIMRAYTWLTEDEDTPHQELADIIHATSGSGLVGTLTEAAIARPRRNCVVFALEDFSGMEGPTGTTLDGVLNLIGVTLDDLFTSVLVDYNTGQALNGQQVRDVTQPQSPVFEAILGVAPETPKVIWREAEYNRVTSSTHSMYKGPVRTSMTGGRSPAIVNQAQTFAIRFGIERLSELINPGAGSWINTAFKMPLTSGLNQLYQGQLDNVLLAWERLSDPVRVAWAGDMAYQESIARGGGTSYTLAGIVTLREDMYKNRAYQGFQAQVQSGYPWVLDEDVRLGERAGWEQDSIIYVDQITGIHRQWDRGTPIMPTLSVADDKDKMDPIARSMRAINSIYSIVGSFMGEGTLFG